MFSRIVCSLACIAIVIPVQRATADDPAVTQEALRGAIEKSLPLLTAGAAGHRENRTCFACHSQGMPVVAITAAKDRGFKIDEEELSKQIAHTVKFLEGNRENYQQGKGQGGQADTAGYALWALAAGSWKPDDTTAAVTEYLLQRHKDKGHWQSTSNRPPTEAGSFTTTYIALYGLDAFGTEAQQERAAARTEQVREWLIKTPAKDNEDRVFRLLALDASGAPKSEIDSAAKELIAKQQGDGGWAQLDGGEPASATKSDAYATGTALVALQQAGGVKTSDPLYQRGLAYLLQSQKSDGSWHVVSRSKPFQAYFETGYPHGNDQFISSAAGSWATWAMVLAIDQAAARETAR